MQLAKRGFLTSTMTIIALMVYMLGPVIPVYAAPSLVIDKIASTTTPAPSQTFTYTIRYRCASLTEDCLGAAITDTIPSSLTIMGYSPAGGLVATATRSSQSLTWNMLSPLPAGSTGVISVYVQFPACGTSSPPASVTNTATFTASNGSTVSDSVTVTQNGTTPACVSTTAPSTTTYKKSNNESDLNLNGSDSWTMTFPSNASAYTITDSIPTSTIIYNIDKLSTPSGLKIYIQCADNGLWWPNNTTGLTGDLDTPSDITGFTGCVALPHPDPRLAANGIYVFNVTDVRYEVPASTAVSISDAISYSVLSASPFSAAQLPNWTAPSIGVRHQNCIQASITTIGTNGLTCVTTLVTAAGPEPDLEKQIIGNITQNYPIGITALGWPTFTPDPNAIPSQVQGSTDIVYALDIRASDQHTDWVDPVITDLLDSNVTFDPSVNWWKVIPQDENKIPATYDPYNDPDCYTPTFETVPNYQGTGRTLIRWIFTNCTMPGGFGSAPHIYIYYTTTIKPGTPANTVINNMLISPVPSTSNPQLGDCANGSSMGAAQTTYWPGTYDTTDLDGDGNTNEVLCKSNVTAYTVPLIADMTASKWVQGTLDSESSRYPIVGDTSLNSATTGTDGLGTYYEYIRNSGNTSITSIDVADILPYVGDTAVLDPLTPRLSTWSLQLSDAITVERNNGSGWVVVPSGDFSIAPHYSTSTNPCRFDAAGDLTAAEGTGITTPSGCTTNPWSGATSSPATGARSFAFRYTPSSPMLPNQQLRITVNAQRFGSVPSTGSIAWNSFAFGATYQDTPATTARMLDSEPIKVGLRIVDIATTAAIGDYIWEDANHNGVQDTNELGLAGVAVRLYNAAGTTLIQSTTTDSTGYYRFDGLTPSTTYRIRLDNSTDYTSGALSGYTLTTQNAGSNDAVDSDAAIVSSYADITATTGTAGTSTMTYDFGFWQPAALGDYVWYDLNSNGAQDIGETGVQNATVRLYSTGGDGQIGGGDDSLIATTTTNASGYYLFSNLVAGSYYVVFDKSTISGTDPVTNAAVVAANWTYTIMIATGDPNNDSNANASGYGQVTYLSTGETDMTWDAGLKPYTVPASPVSVGDFVWEDTNANGVQNAGELGVAGVRVDLLDSSGLPVATTVTDASGAYRFDNLAIGSYSLYFTLPDGMTFTTQNNNTSFDTGDSDVSPTTGATATFTLNPGTTIGAGITFDSTWDAGVITTLSLGNLVWYDANANGLHESTEIIAPGLTVQLLNSAGSVIATTTTDSNGRYLFANLQPGTYSVRVTLPTGYTATVTTATSASPNNGVDNDSNGTIVSSGTVQSAPITLAYGTAALGETDHGVPVNGVVDSTLERNANYTLDFGLVQSASIGDRVWADLNHNGLQDAGETSIANVTIELLNSSGTVVATTTTNASGIYSFANILPGDYSVRLVSSTLPAGYVLTLQNVGADDTIDSDSDTTTGRTAQTTLVAGENDLTWDFGAWAPSSLGNYVWIDADRDGLQDAGETGVPGVTVNLINSAGTVIATTTTDASGLYLFSNLIPGTYSVTFDLTTLPAGYVPTLANVGSDDTLDSDANVTTGTTTSHVLSAAASDLTFDLGIVVQLSSLGDRVWNDIDHDGIQDATEAGIPGVTVSLYSSTGTLLATTTTDATGLYRFDNLSPNTTYQVALPNSANFTSGGPLASYLLTTQDAGTDDALDSDAVLVASIPTIASATTGAPNSHTPTYDFGFWQPASIGNYVWLDANHDGIQNIGEAGIPGVTVNLLDSAGAVVATTTTDASGAYLFTNLVSGDYSVEFVISTLPVGYQPTLANAGADDAIDSDGDNTTGRTSVTTLVAGEHDMSWDFGAWAPSSLGDYVWIDANRDGLQDLTEAGVPGITVNLLDSTGTVIATTTTDASGAYLFENLIPGTYSVTFDLTTLPTGYVPTLADIGADDTSDSDANPTTGTTASHVLPILTSDRTFDMGIVEQLTSLGDYVWLDINHDGIQDSTEAGIAGVTVSLYDASGTLLATTTTDASGLYHFDNLLANTTYQVKIDNPADFTGSGPLASYLLTTQDAGADNTADSDAATLGGYPSIIAATTGIPGTATTTYDFGFWFPASLGNFVWLDADHDGIQDPSDNGVDNVTVQLLDSSGTVIRTTTTDSSGYYSFDLLTPSDYSVRFVVASFPAGYQATLLNAGADDTIDSDGNITTGQTAVTTLVAGEHDLNWDMGLWVPQSLGDFVWFDNDHDGVQDPSETGVADVSVSLLNSAGTVIATTTTDASGLYLFENLIPGDYSVAFDLGTLPTGYIATLADQGSDDLLDSDANTTTGITAPHTLTISSSDLSFDLGIWLPPASIGDLVWNDINANGIQESGELGISGVTVNLYDTSDVLVASTVTDASGFYQFDNLNPNTAYTIKLDNLADYSVGGPLEHANLTASNSGTDDTIDSDATIFSGFPIINATTGIAASNTPTYDTGFWFPASIGNYVWTDLNHDGLQDPSETGIPNVTVNLLNSAGTVIATTTTDASGLYLFENLIPGDYSVAFDLTTLPAGYVPTLANTGVDDTIDSDGDMTGLTAVVTIAAGENNTSLDFGAWFPASIGNYVWTDLNHDGLQDPSEAGIPGVTVNLLNSAGTTIATTTTDASGLYLFENLIPGDYSVAFDLTTLPAGYTPTLANTGADDTIDSDGDATGLTAVVTIAAGENNTSLDFGAYELPASIGDRIWFDQDKDGVQDSSETEIAGVTVNLYDAAGTFVATTTTDASGYYRFDGLDANTTYTVALDNPADYMAGGVLEGYLLTLQDQGADDTIDSDAGLVLGYPTISSAPTGIPTSYTTSYDFGFWLPASIGNYVWADLNHDGIQELSEAGIPGVTVNLLDSAGTVINSTTTDASGFYLFENLIPGDYSVAFDLTTLPAGYLPTLANAGSDDTLDSDANITTGATASITLSPGQANTSLDMGAWLPASIGNYFWLDANHDGVQDPTEVGVPGVTVNLLDSAGTVIATTTTDASGFYLFENLIPGDYSVAFDLTTLPAGYLPTLANAGSNDMLDSDGDTTGLTAVVTIAAGETNTSLDMGAWFPASIGNYVWTDLNHDGIQDPSEPGIAGVTVNLLNSAGTVIATTTTDASGLYLFENLIPGDYSVAFDLTTLPSGYLPTLENAGSDDTTDSDIDPITGQSPIIHLSLGENNTTLDAGAWAESSIGDMLWNDINHNGQQEPSEAGVPGVTVNLLNSAGTVIATTTTDASGFYLFTGLIPGDYQVVFDPSTIPAGYQFTTNDIGGDSSDSDADPTTGATSIITLGAGEQNTTIDAGIWSPVSIGNYVWTDLDHDGIQDPGETGVPGVTVQLLDGSGIVLDTTTTDTSGLYLFENKIQDTYAVAFVLSSLPPGYIPTLANIGIDDTVDSDADPITGITSAAPVMENTADLSFDLGIWFPASISNYVWADLNHDGIQDPSETGIPGVTVNLLDSTGSIIATTATDASGFYLFENLIPGNYSVAFNLASLPTGYVSTMQNTGSDDTIDSDGDATGITAAVTIAAGENNTSLDMGAWFPASIGNFVWADLNHDGIQDPSETGIPNVTVNLLDSAGVIIATTTTDASGLYLFSGLIPGDYSVAFDLATLPAGYQPTLSNTGSDDTIDSDGDATGLTAVVTIAAGENNTSLDMGAWFPASIGNFVWADLNHDGIQDPSETGIPNVTVNLLDSAGAVIATATTDASGLYLFSNLIPAIYSVEFDITTLPAGYEPTVPNINADDTIDSDANPITGKTASIALAPGEANTSLDMGAWFPASIGNYVWADLNRDGIQDPTEAGIPGVTVNLLDSAGTVIATTTTDASGLYLFQGLIPGDYSVAFDLATLPAGYQPTLANAGSDDTLDSDGATINVTLAAGENNTTIDMGAWSPASIGNYVWADLNHDGIQDPTEAGFAGVTVNLLDSAGAVIATTTTDASGYYLFENLIPGDYSVTFDLATLPAGYQPTLANAGSDDTLDSDGATVNVALTAGENNTTIDMGSWSPASIGNFVWADLNHDGIQDPTEAGIPGVTVNLLDSAGAVIATTTTDASGLYLFENLIPAIYSVEFDISTIPAGYEPTVPNMNADDTIDSDANPVTGKTASIALAPGESNTSLDMGAWSPASIGNYVWTDLNHDGLQDPTEAGIPDVTVNLLDSAGTVIATTATDASGLYLFQGLIPGDYSVAYDLTTLPAGYKPTMANIGSDDAIDSDADSTTGITAVVTITAGENNTSLDMGAWSPASIGNYVWTDLNHDGLQDPTEAGIPGVTVNLLDSAGTTIATTTTDASGLYLFSNLIPGDYSVTFDLTTLPAGYAITTVDAGSDDAIDSDGATVNVTLAAGENNISIDMGAWSPASIGNYVWTDLNHDGLQDPTETGIPGVTVNLLDSAGVIIATTATDASGFYLFENLIPGDYSVAFNLASLPTGYVSTTQNSGSDDAMDSDGDATGLTAVITIAAGENNTSLDMGAWFPALIGNYVWTDLNHDGLQDPSEVGIPGVTVNLLNSTGTVIATTTTDASGLYLFENLIPGDYSVAFDLTTLPAGYLPTLANAGSDDTTDSDGDATGLTAIVTIAAGENNTSLDMGAWSPASIGNYVWADLNHDGIQDPSEAGIPGVTVNLLNSTGTVIATTTTDASGLYLFENLIPGDYSVAFDLTTLPAGYTPTLPNVGADDTLDSDGATVSVTLAAGDTNTSVDMGAWFPASIGNYVWTDLNHDGLQDPSEMGIPGVTVNLLDSTGTVIATTTTDASGLYLFENLIPGSYTVEFVVSSLPISYLPTLSNVGADGTLDSNGVTSSVTLAAGETNTSIDMGAWSPASIGNYVWTDLNHDGLQDPSEVGIPGVTVNLLDSAGTVIATTTTDASGLYLFENLIPGDYSVAFDLTTLPAGYLPTLANAGSDDATDSDGDTTGLTALVTIAAGEANTSLDMGAWFPASIGNYVWADLNHDGIQDPSETGIANVTVNLLNSAGTTIATTTTDASGLYLFENLIPGDYSVAFDLNTLPAGYLQTLANAGSDDAIDSDGSTINVTLAAGENNTSIDLGAWSPASIGNYIWTDLNHDGLQDPSEVGIPGVTVNLLDSAGTVIATTTTDASGLYLFENLIPGDYSVAFDLTTLPAGYVPTLTNAGADDAIDSDGSTVSVTLTAGENNTSVDLGAWYPASVGNFVWADLNHDGIQDPSEVGIPGVTVNLLDSAGSVIATTTTDASGLYLFENLIPGDYSVAFDLTTLPAGYAPTLANAGSDDTLDSDGTTVNVTLVAGENNTSVDLGAWYPASVGNFVWADLNHDGIQNPSEAGIPSVTVNLLDSTGTTIATTTTNASGLYLFENLIPGDYSVAFDLTTLPAGYAPTQVNAGSDDTLDSDGDATGLTGVVTIAAGENNTSLDMGAWFPASIGNYVWTDLNHDGLQDPSEVGVPGVTVNLLDSTGTVIATTTTDASGLYLFENLIPGDYSVAFDLNTLPAGYAPTLANTGSDDTIDSDGDTTGITAVVTIAAGENNTSLDFGVWLAASIGNFVWADLDHDGVQEGSEGGIPGVTVNLLNSAGTTIATTTTDASGLYLFENLIPGDYSVAFDLTTLPAGYLPTLANAGSDDTTDSDGDATGLTGVVTIAAGENNTSLDMGAWFPASIGNYVWTDLNHDGLQDPSEVGIPGVTVNLLDSTGTVIATTTTDASGLYLFENLIPGDYSVAFDVTTLPAGYVPTLANTGADDTLDSDGDTVSVSLAAGENNISLDMGAWLPASIGNYVWTDLNRNGIQDPSEVGIPGVTVNLLNSAGTVIATTTTDASGLYLFQNLIPGDYSVVFDLTTLPAGYAPTQVNAGSDDTLDSDGEGATGATASVSLAAGENNISLDMGAWLPASLGNYIWSDENHNGIQDVGEPGIGGIVLHLIDSNGAVAGTAISNADGYYLFSSVVPGDYSIEIDLTSIPTEYRITAENTGTDDENDSDIDPTTGATETTTIVPGENDPSWDIGLYKPVTAIKLSAFTATPSTSGMVIAWTTSLEVQTANFVIYRSTTGRQRDAVRVSDPIIAIGRSTGASYEWIDANPPEGNVTYWLVEQETSGQIEWYGPARTIRPATTTTIFIPIAARQ